MTTFLDHDETHSATISHKNSALRIHAQVRWKNWCSRASLLSSKQPQMISIEMHSCKTIRNLWQSHVIRHQSFQKSRETKRTSNVPLVLCFCVTISSTRCFHIHVRSSYLNFFRAKIDWEKQSFVTPATNEYSLRGFPSKWVEQKPATSNLLSWHVPPGPCAVPQ